MPMRIWEKGKKLHLEEKGRGQEPKIVLRVKAQDDLPVNIKGTMVLTEKATAKPSSFALSKEAVGVKKGG